MDESALDTLTRRLDRLEREARWWRRIGAVALIGAMAGALTGQARVPAQTVEAQRFVVKDADAQPRAVLGATAHGAVLELYDRDGARRSLLGLAGDGSVILSLSAKGEQGGVQISATPYGSSNFQFSDRAGVTRVGTGVTADGSAVLLVNDTAGTARAGLGIAVDGRPFRFP